MNQVLLTVSGSIDPNLAAEVSAGKRPVPDYLAMARAFGADLLDYPGGRQVSGSFGRLLERFGGPNLMLAWACFRQRRTLPGDFHRRRAGGYPAGFFA